jgi:hypothetical protein
VPGKLFGPFAKATWQISLSAQVYHGCARVQEQVCAQGQKRLTRSNQCILGDARSKFRQGCICEMVIPGGAMRGAGGLVLVGYKQALRHHNHERTTGV